MSEADPTPSLQGEDEYVFPKDVHEFLLAADSGQMALSQMADNKSSMLMGASFVVFSLSISDVAAGKASLPLVLLTAFSFMATVLGILTVRPGPLRKWKVTPETANLLYFGSFTNISRAAYIEQAIKVMKSEEAVYRHIAGSVYDHGFVLRKEKYRWLYWSYTFFLTGLIVTGLAVAYELVIKR
ncbi:MULTISPECIES: Pycsar system effector family protein [Sphingomonas]|uniref:Pycsar system effector family protein n=1 Tax=Sphingomonas TaxID=13687 RepID=UPI000DEFFABE|nr:MULTISPECIES: Pycsar system effector family protein [Sphingomonas]